MTYPIDKSIPIPAKGRKGVCYHKGQGPKRVYPFNKMEIGDSFYCESDKVKAAASACKKRTGLSFTVRKEGDGYRIWRIE